MGAQWRIHFCGKAARFIFLVFLSILHTPVEAVQPDAQSLQEGEFYFALSYQNKPIGYVHYGVAQREEQGETVYEINAKSVIRISYFGDSMHRRYESQLLARSSDLKPIHYRRVSSYRDDSEISQCLFQDGRLLVETVSNGHVIDKAEWVTAGDLRLLDDNEYVHWLLLFKSIDLSQEEHRLNVFIPQERTNAIAHVRHESCADESLLCKTVTIQNQTAKAFIRKDAGNLERLEIPEQNFSLSIADAAITSETGAIEMEEEHLIPVTLGGEVERLRSFKVGIKTKVYGKELTEDDLNSYRQIFRGTLHDNFIDGTIEVTPEEYTGEASPAFPIQQDAYAADLEHYSQPEIGIEADDPILREAAWRITDGSENAWEAAVRIVSDVYRNITYDIMTQGSARGTLILGKGDAGEKAKLAIALCRAAGIPARLCGGLVYVPLRGGSLTPYVWIEAHMGPKGWISMDPTMGQYGRVDATHLRLWNEGIAASLHIEPLEQKFASYIHFKPEAKLARPPKKMKHRFTVNGELIGYNIAEISRKVFTKSAAYVVKSKLDLDSTKVGVPHSLHAKSKLLIDERGLPQRYDYTATLSGKPRSIKCSFSKNRLWEELISAGERFQGEFSIKEGAFCLDKDQIEQWAIMMSALPLKVGRKLYVSGFIPQRTAELLITIDVRRKERIKIDGRELQCYVCELYPLGETFYVTIPGHLVKVVNTAQKLIIERVLP